MARKKKTQTAVKTKTKSKAKANTKAKLAYKGLDVELPGLRMHVGRWSARGQAIVCLHGLTANHLSFAVMAKPLAAAGYQVLAPDLRGRGKSDKPAGPYGPDAHVADILALLDALKLKRVILVGHSLGAGIALKIAARAPERIRGLVLMDGGGVLNFGQKIKILAAIRPSLMRLGRVFPNADSYLDIFRNSPLFREFSAETEATLRYELEETAGGYRCNIPRDVIEAELRAQGGSLSPWTMLGQLLLHPLRAIERNRIAANPPYGKLTMPVFIFRAGRHNLKPGDSLLPAEALEKMMREMPDPASLTIKDANHYELAVNEIPERDDALKKFMKSLPT